MSLLTIQQTTSATRPGEVAHDVHALVRRQLLLLAKGEDNRAADEAANVPYWAPLPASVAGHRAAAAALRAAAEQFIPHPSASRAATVDRFPVP